MHEQLIDLAEWGTSEPTSLTAQLYGVYFLQKQPPPVYVKRWLCKLKATTATNALCVQIVEASRVLFVLSRVTTDLL
jgi:hypothetical protein